MERARTKIIGTKMYSMNSSSIKTVNNFNANTTNVENYVEDSNVFLCSMKLSRRFLPDTPNHKLADLKTYLVRSLYFQIIASYLFYKSKYLLDSIKSTINSTIFSTILSNAHYPPHTSISTSRKEQITRITGQRPMWL